MAFVPDKPLKFVPDAPPPAPKTAAAPKEPSTGAKVADFAASATPIPAVENALSGITGGLGSLLDTLTGSPPGTHNIAYQPRTSGGKAMQHEAAVVTEPVIGAISKGLANTGLEGEDIGGSAQQALEDTLKERIPQALGSIGTVMPAIGAAGRAVGGIADTAAAAAAEAASPAGQLGLRTAKNAPIARTLAGKSGQEALTLQNNAAGKAVAGAEAGVPHGVDVTPTSLSAARGAPGGVLDRAAAELPTGPLSPTAAQMVESADANAGRITKGTPNAVAQIQDIKDRLRDPKAQFTGPEIRAEANGLRADSNLQSADPDIRQVSAFRLKVADALDQHVEDTLPPDSSTSIAQVKLARQTLGKNYTVQDLLSKGGDVDLQKLAQLHRDSPNLLTGNLRTLADFADKHPEVSTLPSNATRYEPPGLTGDVGQINILNPRSWIQPLAGSAARSSLTGPTGSAARAAARAPVAGLAGEFDPIEHPQAPEAGGITAEPLEQKLGDVFKNQRGAVGAPTDISGLRKLQNEPRTYTGMKPEDVAALEAALEKLKNQPRTYSGTPLGNAF